MNKSSQLDADLAHFQRELSHIDEGRIRAIQNQRNRRDSADTHYSLTRLLNALSEDRVKHAAPYEAECSERIAGEVGRQPRPGFCFVPVSQGQRDLTAGIAGAGGYLVGTEVAPGDVFANFLFASSVYIRQGVTQLNLRGNASIPKVTGVATAGWLSSEGSSLSESQLAFVVAAASPKTVGAYCEVSRQLLLQSSPAAQALVMQHMARAVASELDGKLISGSGASGQPTGLLNTAGIGSVSGTSLAYAGILDAVKNIEDVSGVVAPDKVGVVIAPDAARLLRARELAVGSGMLMNMNTLAGLPAQTTKSVPNGSLILGDWSQIVLLNWGVLEVGVDPFGVNSALFAKGLFGLRAIWTCDICVLHAESFQKITSIT